MQTEFIYRWYNTYFPKIWPMDLEIMIYVRVQYITNMTIVYIKLDSYGSIVMGDINIDSEINSPKSQNGCKQSSCIGGTTHIFRKFGQWT